VTAATSTSPTKARDTVTLTFRAEGGGPPLPIRVRHLLKFALRSLGLRCVTAHQSCEGEIASTVTQ
jgi:hypothetical protein